MPDLKTIASWIRRNSVSVRQIDAHIAGQSTLTGARRQTLVRAVRYVDAFAQVLDEYEKQQND